MHSGVLHWRDHTEVSTSTLAGVLLGVCSLFVRGRFRHWETVEFDEAQRLTTTSVITRPRALEYGVYVCRTVFNDAQGLVQQPSQSRKVLSLYPALGTPA